MFNELQNLTIECWLHAGPRLGVADQALCLRAEPNAIQILLKVIDEMSLLGPPAKRALTLQPTQRKDGCTTIRIVHSPIGDDLQEMSVTCAESKATPEFTPPGLHKSRRAVELWRSGCEDFSVHPDRRGGEDRIHATKDLNSAEVWFWRGLQP